jgi:DAACS family dicarboxylate/amino acid:cation (Na+ or H+) symporter
MKLWTKIFIALVLGVITGLLLGPHSSYLKPVGTVFLSLINMIIIPLIFASMTAGIASIHDPQKLTRVGIKTLALYLTTTIVSIVIAITCAKLFEPGAGMGLEAQGTEQQAATSLSQIFLSLLPTNPISAMAQGHVMQLIVFSVFLGLAISYSGEKGKPLLKAIESLADVMYRLTSIIMEFAPIGVFAIMAWVAGSFGFNVLLPLFKFLGVYYFACAIHVLVVFCGILRVMAKVKPLPFFKGMRDAIMVAFTTCSSSATLPTSMHCTHENVGVSRNICNFVLPLGVTINMNGTAIFQSMCAIFIAQAYGITLDMYAIITIILSSTLSAVATAGVSGSGFIMLSVVISSAGLPLEGLAIIAGIDRLREMGSTVLNVLGDAVCAVYISKSEGEFDEQRYYQPELVKFREG